LDIFKTEHGLKKFEDNIIGMSGKRTKFIKEKYF
jgi:hypothetical protein